MTKVFLWTTLIAERWISSFINCFQYFFWCICSQWFLIGSSQIRMIRFLIVSYITRIQWQLLIPPSFISSEPLDRWSTCLLSQILFLLIEDRIKNNLMNLQEKGLSYLSPEALCCCCCCQVSSVVSDSLRPHGLQPIRLLCPWDSPGKNNGVGCHFLLQCMKVKSQSEVAQSCLTPSDPRDCSPPGSSVHGILQARVLEWDAIAFSRSALLLANLEPKDQWIDHESWLCYYESSRRLSPVFRRHFPLWRVARSVSSDFWKWKPCNKCHQFRKSRHHSLEKPDTGPYPRILEESQPNDWAP